MLDITLVLDRSGSMSAIRDDTVGGVNTFIAAQQAEGLDARLTLHLFDHEHEVVHDAVPIAHVPPLTVDSYVPRGWTALYDAIWRALDAAWKRPGDSHILAIVTDGQENRSHEVQDTHIDGVHTRARERVMQRITEWRSRGREVTFLAANQDAIQGGVALGIDPNLAMNFNAGRAGTAAVFASAGRMTRAYSAGIRGQSLSYTVEERVSAMVPDHNPVPDPNTVVSVGATITDQSGCDITSPNTDGSVP